MRGRSGGHETALALPAARGARTSPGSGGTPAGSRNADAAHARAAAPRPTAHAALSPLPQRTASPQRARTRAHGAGRAHSPRKCARFGQDGPPRCRRSSAAEKKGKKEKAAANKAEAEDTAKRKQAADAEAKSRRLGRGIHVRLSDACVAELDEVSKRLRKLLQRLTAQLGPCERVHRRRRDRSPAAASSAGPRKDSGKASEGPAAGAEPKPLHSQPPGHVADALMVQAPGEADGSLLTAPGEVFASLAVAHLRHATMRRHLRRAQAWVRLRELVRKAASRRFEWLGSALWLQAFDSRRRREAGDAPAITVRLMHPEVMGKEWGVDIAVFASETASSVKAYALGMLACGDLIPGARARRWTSARIRQVRARAGEVQCGRACACAIGRACD
jgi:hypothetical protein